VKEDAMKLGAILLAAVLLALPATARAQVADHLECYKIKDPVRLAAVVDLDAPQFGLEAGCQVKRARMFCVPAENTVISAKDKATGNPITPLSVSGPNPGDRICYKVKCPLPFPPDTQVTDQFGTRTVTGLKPFLLCAPAVEGGVPPTPTPTPILPAATPTLTATATPRPVLVDNGDGTVTDYQTGVQWEKKDGADGWPNFANPHDVDNAYSWSASGSAPDGTAFTDFLVKLNTPPCFAGQCDWRLPSIVELQMILPTPFPCYGNPCIDPIFGPTIGAGYWSATTDATDPTSAWLVSFYFGQVYSENKGFTRVVRAVRTGS
jgi:hypothetical protein